MRATSFLACCALAALGALACATAPGAGPGGGDRAVYQSRCTSCHRLYEPGERTRAGWASVLERMAPRAHLSGTEREAIRRYLSANAKDAGAPAPAPAR